jgi:uncharacterized protein YqgC (DUF456 family)
MAITFAVLLFILLFAGICMAAIPSLPGLLYMFLIVVAFSFIDHFAHFTGMNILIFGIIAGVAMLVDFFSGILGAKWGGAHWTSLFSGFAGLLIGSFVIPIPILGSLLGMFLGVLISELYRTQNLKSAGKAAAGSFAGSVVGIAINLFCALLFFGLALYFFIK